MKHLDSSIFRKRRTRMVEEQLKARGIREERVLNAFLEIPRHLFVPEAYLDEAYNDYPLPIGYNQTISQPYMVGSMTELLELKPEDRVLEIGTGSGYQAAILAHLAKEVFTVEKIAELLKSAQECLERLGYQNIHFRLGDGTLGWEEEAPFDGIIVTAGAPYIPPPLQQQLAIGGRIVIPVGSSFSQILILMKKLSHDDYETTEFFDCAFVSLLGKYGFSESE